MSIPKKGARKIIVDGTLYLWRIKRKPTYCQEMGWGNMSVGIQKGDANGSTLIVATPYLRSYWHREANESITPADIESYIESALAKGWDPVKGPAFELDMRKA